jgi:cold-inducible RNA-binding protein
MNKNLYVGNLSQKVTDDDLRNNFSEAGAVASVSIIKDKFSGVSRGFGFVEMETEEGAQEAIKKFNGGDLDGKTITVNEARPKTEFRVAAASEAAAAVRAEAAGAAGTNRPVAINRGRPS